MARASEPQTQDTPSEPLLSLTAEARLTTLELRAERDGLGRLLLDPRRFPDYALEVRRRDGQFVYCQTGDKPQFLGRGHALGLLRLFHATLAESS